jgi:hypothetical protein
MTTGLTPRERERFWAGVCVGGVGTFILLFSLAIALVWFH